MPEIPFAPELPPTPIGSATSPHYDAKAALVRTMFPVLGTLLEAGSRVDSEIKSIIASLPDGLTFGMSIFGSEECIRMRVEGSTIVLVDKASIPTPELDIVFKHLGVAFLVLSFQESTALAFGRNRMLVHGSTAYAMRLTRCLDRMQAVTLPGVVATRALKAVPPMPLGERLPLVASYYASAAKIAARGRR